MIMKEKPILFKAKMVSAILDGSKTQTRREAKVHKMPPSEKRWKERSRTYDGIADAMAQQWG